MSRKAACHIKPIEVAEIEADENSAQKLNKGWKQKLNRAVRKLETKLEHGEKEKV